MNDSKYPSKANGKINTSKTKQQKKKEKFLSWVKVNEYIFKFSKTLMRIKYQ